MVIIYLKKLNIIVIIYKKVKMSVSSCGSGMTVSAFGEDEMELEVAIDKCFNGLQSSLNNCHCSTRELCMLVDKDEDFETMVEQSEKIEDFVSDMSDLFKELNSVVKQIRGKPTTTEQKEWWKRHQCQRKLDKIEEKERLKREQEQELNTIEE